MGTRVKQVHAEGAEGAIRIGMRILFIALALIVAVLPALLPVFAWKRHADRCFGGSPIASSPPNEHDYDGSSSTRMENICDIASERAAQVSDRYRNASDDMTVPSLDEIPKTARGAIYLAVSLFIAVLAAIGITGDVLNRLIRHEPNLFAAALSIVVVGAAIPLIASAAATPRLRKNVRALITGRAVTAASTEEKDRSNLAQRVADALGAALVAVGIIFAIILGAQSVGQREQPTLTLNVSYSSKSTLLVSARAAGASLAVEDKLLLRVVSLSRAAAEDDDVYGSCASAASPRVPTDTNAHYLYWADTGADNTGAVTDSMTATIAAKGVRFVCAYSTLSPKPRKEDTLRFAVAVVDVADLRRPPVSASSTIAPG